MTNDEFIRYAKAHIRDYLPPGLEEAQVRITKIVKPNDEKYTGMSLMKPGNDVGPQIPLEQFAQQQRQGRDLDDLMIEIAETITRFKPPKMEGQAEDGTFDLANFDFVSQFLTTKLCDPATSAEYLADKPWTPVGDWGLLYRLKLLVGGGSTGSAPITYEMFELWDIDVPTLHRTAVDNESSKDPAWMSGMDTVIAGKAGKGFNLLDGRKLNPGSRDMFVLSNKSHFNGACVVGWEGVLDRVADVLGRDFYILPTSIHEVMLRPAFSNVYPQDLEASLQAGNRNPNVVHQEDILSDRIQYYDRRKHQLRKPERRWRR